MGAQRRFREMSARIKSSVNLARSTPKSNRNEPGADRARDENRTTVRAQALKPIERPAVTERDGVAFGRRHEQHEANTTRVVSVLERLVRDGDRAFELTGQ